MKSGKIRDVIKEFFVCFTILFLFSFMLLIMGPAEIFFTNVQEFDFVYGEFAFKLIGYGIFFALIGSAIMTLMPYVIRKVLLSVVFALSVAGYSQVMFFNKDLDLLGVNPEGYVVESGRGIANLLIWCILIAAILLFAILKEAACRKAICYISVCLLIVQGIAYNGLIN